MRVLLKEEVTRISYLTKYDRSKTFNENLLEQVIGAPNQGMIDVQSMKDFLRDPHKVLTALSIGFTILGMIPTPASGVLLALGTAADVVDAFIYYNDGETYMGTIMLALAVIPGGEFAKIVKNSIPIGPFKALIKKAKESISRLTPSEIKQLKNYFDSFTKHADEIGKVFTHTAVNKLVSKIPSIVGRLPSYFALHTSLFILKSIGFLTKISIKIGATAFAADTVYVYFYGTTIERYKKIQELKRLGDAIKKYYNGDTKKFKTDYKNQLVKSLEDPEVKKEIAKHINQDSNMRDLISKLEASRADSLK